MAWNPESWMQYKPLGWGGPGGTIPSGAGYGSLIPSGVTGPAFPTGPGYNATPNNTSGYNLSMNRPSGYTSTIAPWIPPTIYPGGGYGIPGTPGANMGPPGSTAGGTVPVTGTPPKPGQVPVGSIPAGRGVGGGNVWMNTLLGQVAGMQAPMAPYLSGSGLPQGIENLVNQNIYQQNQANARNQQMMSFATQSLMGQGASAKQDATLSAKNASAAVDQDLINRGLTGSTVAPTMQRGVQFDLNRALQGIDEKTAQMLIQILQSAQTKGPDSGQFNEFLRSAYSQPQPANTFSVNYV